MAMELVYLSLGSNMGDRQQNLENAVTLLEQDRLQLSARSSIYEAEPQDVTYQPWFLNMAVACETSHSPLRLLTILNEIEKKLGRVRSGAMLRGPRLIDIDIIFFGGLVVEGGELTIPHPRMMERRFVLEPLIEIDPDLKHPATHERLQTTLQNLTGQMLRKL